MNGIGQNSAIASMDKALVPGPLLIDGRTEQDRLCFLADFASLINFYDQTNTINGNWSPFLLKDPAFLLAYISKTRFAKFHSLYLATCNKIEPFLTEKRVTKDVVFAMNNLFDQLTHLFIRIERWTYYMQRSGEQYNLKNYVLQQVKENFSRYFWAIIALRQSLSNISGIEPVKYYLFDSFDEIIWKQNKDKSPYWDILGLKPALKSNKGIDIFTALTQAGDKLFDFLHLVIKSAATEFEKLKSPKTKYPDTILLRTFVNLLQVHQEQLNRLSQKHLHFYYKDILKQSELPASPDSAFLCAALAKPGATFMLPAGTLFDAGLDAQKKPIQFANPQEVNLNPGTITGAYTMARLPLNSSLSSLYLQNITSPGTIKKDADGKIQNWDTFGGTATTAPSAMGIAFASPMLLLREGERTVVLSMGCTGDNSLQMLQQASYSLSTQKAWLDITKNTSFKPTAIDPLNITIMLDGTIPPIEPFLNNPDGVESKWPMLKIEFNSFPGSSEPPVLNSLKIAVTVSGIKTFQLYNDSGALSTKNPYPLFGPTPTVNSSFIIGNNEIFSKPLGALYIELDWDKLPDDFQAYYQQYNNILPSPATAPATATTPVPGSVPPTPPKKTGFFTWLGNLVKSILSIFKKKQDPSQVQCDPPPANKNIPFNNVCFTVDFNLLSANTWQPFNMTKRQVITVDSNNQVTAPSYQQDTKCCPVAVSDNLLFSTIDIPATVDANGVVVAAQNCVLTDASFFAYTPLMLPGQVPVAAPVVAGTPAVVITPAVPGPTLTPDPEIQNTPLKYTDTSASGFMKIVFNGPSYGFGSAIYPNVVSGIALKNAWSLFNKCPVECIIPAANLPFAPKLAGFTAHYTASQSYDFTSTDSTYPIQCFLYAPFKNYAVYDSAAGITDYFYNMQPATGVTKTGGIPLYPFFYYDGFLFLQMENLVPSNSINLYFELARKYVVTTTAKEVGYYYLGDKGWQQLPVLADGTNNFSCSGIVQVNVPDDFAGSSPVMADKSYWLSIAIKGDPAAFAQTVFLTTNGFEVQRSGATFLTDNTAPKLAAGVISKPITAIPQIAAFTQPFPSFGGKAAETGTKMHRRVSNRLKTKDRAVSQADYFRLIKQQFADVYYAKAVCDKTTKNTAIYVVKAYENWTEPSAFMPLVSECTEEKITTFLTERSSAFSNIRVSNFNLQKVQVIAVITLKSGFELQGVSKNINDALNIFLSPWITSDSPQVVIDQEITNAQVANFIRGINGVDGVESVSFQTKTTDKNNNEITVEATPVNTIAPVNETTLLVSGMDHDIQCKV